MRFLPVVWLATAALLVPSVASAHLALRRASPAADARLERAPDAITLWFTQRPQLGFSRLTLVGPGGTIALGALAADTGNAVRAAIPAALGPGAYTVQWQTASADGHPIRGEFRFTVAGVVPTSVDTSAVTAPATHVHEPSAEQHREHAGYREVRWIEFAALLAILGVIGFQHLVLPALASRGVATTDAFHRARRIGQMALPAYFAAAAVRLYAEWELLRTMTSDTGATAQMRQIVTGTTWGSGWLTGVAGALLVLGGWRLAASRRAGSTTLAAIGGLAMAVSPALTGHAAAASPVALNVALDASHVLMAGFWVGSLFIMLVAGVPALMRVPDGNPDVAIAAMVNSFHPVALVAAPFVVLSGAGSAWLRLGDPANILGSGYGQVLVIKVMLVLCVAVLGVHNSARARRRLGAPDATRTFRVTAWAEVAVAALVLVVTTILIVTPIPAQPLFP